MTTSFYTAITGSKSMQSSMDIIGDNVANVNTVGFRGNYADFDSLLSQTVATAANGYSTVTGAGIGTTNQVGLGVRVASTSMVTTQGSIQSTDRAFDLAIGGTGWFAVQRQDGSTAYTRNGAFYTDNLGNFVTTNGQKVFGMMSSNIVNNGDGTGSLSSDESPTGLLSQTATTLFLPSQLTCPGDDAVPAEVTTLPTQEIVANENDTTLNYNFTKAATGSTVINFDSVSSNVGSIEIVDSSGNAIYTSDLTPSQLQNGNFEWSGNDSSGTAMAAGTYTAHIIYPDPSNQQINYTLPFSTTANIVITDASGTVIDTLTPSNTHSGTNTIVWDGRDSDGNIVAGGTYFATASYVSKTATPAIPEGYLTGYGVKSDGSVVASFTNGKTVTVAQVPLYNFQNDQGLMSVGDNMYVQSANSGEAFIMTNASGEPTNGAVIQSNALEMSNVGLSTSMTNMIITQRAFDANAKCITTSDQMIQKAIALKRG